MAYTVKAHSPCIRCGEPTNRRIRVTRVAQCLDCSLERMESQTTELAERRGDAYTHWQLAMRRYADKLASSTLDS